MRNQLVVGGQLFPEFRPLSSQGKGGYDGVEIPIHNHFYVQTMYILTGQFEYWRFDPETDEIVEKVICGPGDSIYVPSMELHGMRNINDQQEATFLCCIANVYDDISL